MALESAALAIGKTVSSHAAQAWLNAKKDHDARRKDLVELMQNRFPDRLLRRRVERQIEDIADSVAERILRLCAHEYDGLSERDKRAVLAEISLTFSRADLSDQALFADDIDAFKLSQRLILSMPNPMRDFDEAAARFYEVALHECCDCLVRIVLHLPQFSARASAETLSRLTTIAESVSGVLARLPLRSLDAPQGTDHDEEFTRRYLEHISNALDTLELIGVRVERYRPRTLLNVAYVSLSATVEESASSIRSPRERGTSLQAWHHPSEQMPITQRVEKVLSRGRLTLLRADAGGGKTTLLRWLAVTAARQGFQTDMVHWNGCVPFLIKLRSYADRSLPSTEQFLEGEGGKALSGIMPKGWVHRRLRSGRGLLLVDGVDELTGPQRQMIRPWLRELLSAYPDMRVVVTSRPPAARATWLSDEGFLSAFLERMTPADTRALIRHWHSAVKYSRNLPCAPEALPAYEAALLARLEASPNLQAMAASPILAAMLCALNLDRETQLPRDRMGLYHAALELLLERRDSERGIPSYETVELERAQKTQILQDIAWRLSITNRVELPKNTVLRRIEEKLPTMPRVTGSAELILEHLLHRSGIIREPAQGRIDFIHRTIQEYLTAKQAADDGDVEPLIAGAHRDQWREVVVMAGGHANSPTRRDLLEGLLRRIDDEPERGRRLKLVVAACLETLPAIPVDLREAIDNHIASLIPPRDMASARSLSTVGETLLARLPSELNGLPLSSACACIQAAALVNGPRALDVLTCYKDDARWQVQWQLNKVWGFFDPREYANRVIAAIPPETHLYLHTQGQVDAVASLPPRRGFTINNEHPDLSGLRPHLPTIVNLWVGHAVAENELFDMSLMQNLQNLRFDCTRLSSIRALALSNKMTGLRLTSLKEVGDVSFLRTLTHLEQLGLSDCPQIHSLEDLPELTNVYNLNLANTGLDVNLSALIAAAPKLSQLILIGHDWTGDLTPLAHLELEILGLPMGGVSDIQPLAEIDKLESLDLGWNPIESLDALAGLPRLRTLNLSYCTALTDIRPLRSVSTLRELDLSGAKPGLDLSPLAGNRRVHVRIGPDQEVENERAVGRRIERQAAEEKPSEFSTWYWNMPDPAK
jgi:hypothetical protein